MEHSKLLRKIALSFALSTGLEFDDLYQEANLAYLEALRTHDATKGKITTYLWHCVHNRLKNYIKQEEIIKCKKFDGELLPMDYVETDISINEIPFWESLNNEAQIIV